MNTWSVELIIQNTCYPIEIKADEVCKVDFNELKIDGEYWYAPMDLDITFGEIEVIEED